jgi:cellulose synthase/poly-beta-1,6-N-acetylglucosamine synthase-like glycosyltransferase
LIDAFVLAVIVLKPITRNYDDSDKGSGNIVLMDPPLRPSYARCAGFLLISFIVSAFLVELKSPNLPDAYHGLVTQLMQSVINDPTAVQGYARSLLPVFQISILAFGVAMALTFHASLARRTVILLNTGLFLLVSAVVDAFLGIFVIVTGLPIGPTPVVSLLMQYTVAGLVVFRVTFTSFQLPRKTQLPLRRGHDWRDDALLIGCVAAAIATTATGAVFLVQKFGHNTLLTLAVLFACAPYLILFINIYLGIAKLIHRRRVNPTSDRPPVDVIIPAFNEELDIADLLRTIDVAAGRYQGPVKVYLCDDGSFDDTVPLAEETMAAFEHATGEILMGSHSGKSAALNQALRVCTADIVVRVDADCRVHPDCLLYTTPYFADPKVGMVGAFTLPKEPYTTWIDRLRMFELIVSFGFVRPTSDVVDGVFCIPGTYTAFRRQPALEVVGGFTEGMYGEDVDFTYAMTRIGYRCVIDTRVRSYEDVPNTQRQLRTQRTRWNRGGTMAFARFVPVATGLSGPRYWFFATRQAIKRFLAPLHLTVFMYVLATAILNPNGHINLARVGFVLVFRAVPAVIEIVACTIYYRKWRELIWLPMQYVFVMLRHYYCLECFLSFNARPVVTGRIAEALRPATQLRPLETSEA